MAGCMTDIEKCHNQLSYVGLTQAHPNYCFW